jgi:hypothetical protein
MASLLGVLLGMAALFAALASPLATAAAVVGLLTIGKLLQVGLATAVRRARNRVRVVSVPGVGTVRFRVVPR